MRGLGSRRTGNYSSGGHLDFVFSQAQNASAFHDIDHLLIGRVGMIGKGRFPRRHAEKAVAQLLRADRGAHPLSRAAEC